MRKLGLFFLLTIVVLGAFGVFFASSGMWSAAVATVLLSVLTIAVFVALATRYIARLLRTEFSKLRTKTAQSSSTVDELLHGLKKDLQQLDGSVARLSKSIPLSHEQNLKELESEIRKIARTIRSHTASTVLHSTNDIEALLQIYAKFPDTKLPMPSSGGWAVDAKSLAYLLEYVRDTKPRRILELGSGTSTIWLGYLCKAIGAKMIAVDHLEHYLEQTRAELERHGLTDWVDLHLAPLEDLSIEGDEFSWYSLDALNNVSDIDLLVVDGPPAATGPKARFPALPKLERILSHDASVILDDAHRPDEMELLHEWLTLFPEFNSVVIGTPRLAIIRRGEANRP